MEQPRRTDGHRQPPRADRGSVRLHHSKTALLGPAACRLLGGDPMMLAGEMKWYCLLVLTSGRRRQVWGRREWSSTRRPTGSKDAREMWTLLISRWLHSVPTWPWHGEETLSRLLEHNTRTSRRWTWKWVRCNSNKSLLQEFTKADHRII